jgi:hypothetical protein
LVKRRKQKHLPQRARRAIEKTQKEGRNAKNKHKEQTGNRKQQEQRGSGHDFTG